ncbi:thiol:disulfide interchange protein DsbA/DsbL [Marinibactrum halimedae]|uniref:Thiol:disulfide interchange protein n=1 Tax=Marinibactrum halimedae TaxID=1444977 RepID=A0AA37T256_9GAMM|nr:thiol:disulfide interchange protein DsbA/DsbL [Marinibactrum halimedae]MCD9460920.1 thiol:disulfide interchange protein DsbA/DsbL [Marinibactrum halimedae]GLS24594.1 thiol:disulfide interchange protein DsbA [Marinibactrum halimedae]
MRVMFGLLAILMSLAACAEPAKKETQYMAGKHYQVIGTPVKTEDPSKIEVAEVFWYACGHCFKIEPVITQWKKTLGNDVNFVRSPAIWNGPMEVHARAFYAAKALGIFDKVHQPLFDAMNVERKRLATPEELAEFFTQFGVEEEKFMKTYKSFGVVSQVNQANARARGYGITGTPEIIVDGKYRISANLAGSQQEMLNVAKFLVEKLRAERS